MASRLCEKPAAKTHAYTQILLTSQNVFSDFFSDFSDFISIQQLTGTSRQRDSGNLQEPVDNEIAATYRNQSTAGLWDLQKPVDSDDETDVLCRQTDGSQHEQHGDEAGARHARRSHARQRRRQAETQRAAW